MKALEVNTVYEASSQIPLAYVSPAEIIPDETVIFNSYPRVTEKTLNFKVEDNWNAANLGAYPKYGLVVSGVTTSGSVGSVEVSSSNPVPVDTIIASCTSGTNYTEPYPVTEYGELYTSGAIYKDSYFTAAVTKSGNTIFSSVDLTPDSNNRYLISDSSSSIKYGIIGDSGTYTLSHAWIDNTWEGSLIYSPQKNNEIDFSVGLPSSAFTAKVYNLIPSGMSNQSGITSPLEDDYLWTVVNLSTSETSAHAISQCIGTELFTPITVIPGQVINLDVASQYTYGYEPNSARFTAMGISQTPKGNLYGPIVRFDASGSFGITLKIKDQDSNVVEVPVTGSFSNSEIGNYDLSMPLSQASRYQLGTILATIPDGVTSIRAIYIQDMWTCYYNGYKDASLTNPTCFVGIRLPLEIVEPQIKATTTVRKGTALLSNVIPDQVRADSNYTSMRASGDTLVYNFPFEPSLGKYTATLRILASNGFSSIPSTAKLFFGALGPDGWVTSNIVYKTLQSSDFSSYKDGVEATYSIELDLKVTNVTFLEVGIVGLGNITEGLGILVTLPTITTETAASSKTADIFLPTTNISATIDLSSLEYDSPIMTDATHMRIKLLPMDALPSKVVLTTMDGSGVIDTKTITYAGTEQLYTTFTYTTDDAKDYGELTLLSDYTTLLCGGATGLVIQAYTTGKLAVSLWTNHIFGEEHLLDTPIYFNLSSKDIAWSGVHISPEDCWKPSFKNGLVPRFYEINGFTPDYILSEVSGYFIGKTYTNSDGTTGTITTVDDIKSTDTRNGQKIVLFYSIPEIAESTYSQGMDGVLKTTTIEPNGFRGLSLYTDHANVLSLNKVIFTSGNTTIVGNYDLPSSGTSTVISADFTEGKFKFKGTESLSGYTYNELKDFKDILVEYTYRTSEYIYSGYYKEFLDLNPKTGHFITTTGTFATSEDMIVEGGVSVIHSAAICSNPVLISLRPSYCCVVKSIGDEIVLTHPKILERDVYLRHHFNTLTNDPDFLGEENQHSGIILGSITVAKVSDPSSLTVIDARSFGGGIPEELETPYDDYMWDIGGWDGNPVSSGGKVIVQIPKSVLERFNESQVRDIVKRYIAAGIASSVEFV